MAHKFASYRNPVIYEIYPRSFFQMGGDHYGQGTLRGIIAKLPYIASLGVDAIWLAPVYQSPMVDGGYDVSDHLQINPAYGMMVDMEALIDEAHAHGLGVIQDIVINHTSDQHAWFRRAVAGDSAYEDYYIWRDPKPDGSAPNNWIGRLGHPAWTWCPQRQQYYHHFYLPQQPNLNIRHPKVRDAHRNIIQFWKDKGVDGFRFDAVSAYMHDTQFRDNPPLTVDRRHTIAGQSNNPYSYQDHQYDILLHEGAEYTQCLRRWAGDEMFLLGEVTVAAGATELVKIYTGEGKLDVAYAAELSDTWAQDGIAHTVRGVLSEMEECSRHYGWWLSNHDSARHPTRMSATDTQAKQCYAMLMAILPGPWIMYQGEELGLEQPSLSYNVLHDLFDKRYWPNAPGRDGARVPLPWTEDSTTHYGFSAAAPWLPMDWPEGQSVEAQETQPDSMLHFTRHLLASLRKRQMHHATLNHYDIGDGVIKLTYDNKVCGWFNFSDNQVALPDKRADIITTMQSNVSHLPPCSAAIFLQE